MLKLRALGCLAVVVLLSQSVRASSVTVPAGDVAALIVALNDPAVDTIDLTSGTYSVTAADNFMYGPNAFPVIHRSITINGNGSVIARSGKGVMRFFCVSGGFDGSGATGNLTLNSLELQNGLALGGNGGVGNEGGGGGAGLGGAIFNQGTVTLNAVTLDGNLAQGGIGGAAPGSAQGEGGGGGMFGSGGSGAINGGGGGGGGMQFSGGNGLNGVGGDGGGFVTALQGGGGAVGSAFGLGGTAAPGPIGGSGANGSTIGLGAGGVGGGGGGFLSGQSATAGSGAGFGQTGGHLTGGNPNGDGGDGAQLSGTQGYGGGGAFGGGGGGASASASSGGGGGIGGGGGGSGSNAAITASGAGRLRRRQCGGWPGRIRERRRRGQRQRRFWRAVPVVWVVRETPEAEVVERKSWWRDFQSLRNAESSITRLCTPNQCQRRQRRLRGRGFLLRWRRRSGTRWRGLQSQRQRYRRELHTSPTTVCSWARRRDAAVAPLRSSRLLPRPVLTAERSAVWRMVIISAPPRQLRRAERFRMQFSRCHPR